ncbi:MAG: DNA alkylation repair protein [Crocinitomicaceae bacterium]|nr:DNA alkylation repair protein [Crocinitomicaceae bacterium]
MDVLDRSLQEHQNPVKAKNMAAYLKNRFACYGIKAPVRNKIQKEWFKRVKSSAADPWDLVYNLWNKDQREYQYIAVDFVNSFKKKDISIDDYNYLEELITTKSWWETVDGLASNAVGTYFQKFPEQIDLVLTKWRNADNFWLNRTCLIFQLKYKDQVDFELLKSLIIQYQNVDEFFIQKAIGWSLRQYSKFNSEDAKEFVEEIGLTGLARREAVKYLS